MSIDDLPLVPSDDLVAAAWIGSIPGFTTAMTGRKLPPDTLLPDSNGNTLPAPWLQTGFVTVAVVGGTPDPLLPVHRPVIEVKCWATLPGSNDPPWEWAKALGTAILHATWDRFTISRRLVPQLDGVTYPAVSVQSAYMATHFRPLFADVADYACIQGDLALSWTGACDLIT